MQPLPRNVHRQASHYRCGTDNVTWGGVMCSTTSCSIFTAAGRTLSTLIAGPSPTRSDLMLFPFWGSTNCSLSVQIAAFQL
eukprot:2384934-Rhodomonas_salina.1